MITVFDIRRFVAYAIIVFILFVSSGSSDLSNDKNLLIGGWLIFTAAYFYLENLIKPSFIILTGIFVSISMLYYVINGAYNQVTYLGFFMKIYLAYYCRDICKHHFYGYFVKVIFVLTGVSLVFFTLQLVSFDTMYNLNNFFRVERDFIVKSSSMIYTMVPIHQYRNCGFMWEPGAFVTILIMTFYLNLFLLKEPLTSRRNIIFIIAILTTQSTMGILALVIPLAILLSDFIVQNRTYQQLSVVVVPIVLVVSIIVFTQVDFLYQKMAHEIMALDDELIEVEKGNEEDYIVSVTRSASVILDMRTIRQYPLLGIGVDMRTTGFKKLGYSEKLETSCGSTILMLRFGLIGFAVYSVLLYIKSDFDRSVHKLGWVVLVNYALFTQEISASAFFHLFIF